MENNEKNQIIPGTLYLVATPIGNLSDISDRAKKILSEVNFIAAEDTRVSAKLLSAINVSKPMVIYQEHNKMSSGGNIAERLANGESCALITDAGTPAISDPGEDIVKLCIDYNINVTSVPGPCAAITALTLSGFNTKQFTFEGFVDGRESSKRERFSSLKAEKRTMIFYCSPHDLKENLSLMYDEMGERRIALCRELTKLNEEIMRVYISEAIAYYNEKEPRGEYVLVVEGSAEDSGFWINMTVAEHVDFYINSGLSKMDAVKAVAKDRGLPKNTIYKSILN